MKFKVGESVLHIIRLTRRGTKEAHVVREREFPATVCKVGPTYCDIEIDHGGKITKKRAVFSTLRKAV